MAKKKGKKKKPPPPRTAESARMATPQDVTGTGTHPALVDPAPAYPYPCIACGSHRVVKTLDRGVRCIACGAQWKNSTDVEEFDGGDWAEVKSKKNKRPAGRHRKRGEEDGISMESLGI